MRQKAIPPHYKTRDPLAAYMCRAVVLGSGAPMPLVDTRFDVQIDAGLSLVMTTRVFRNAENVSIEATITFPVPVRAVLFGLTARIGDRVLSARSEARRAATATYETAIETGQTAVLHEEVLKGIHKLSVGHVPPGAEIDIVTMWVMPLAVLGGRGHLRIPLTSGDVYGRSPLPPEDELLTGGPQQAGKLSVRCEGDVQLHGKPLNEPKTVVPLNRPIDLSVPLWTPRRIVGKRANGELVGLTIGPIPESRETLDIAILIDRSGSMGGQAGLMEDTTAHDLVKRGLLAASDDLEAEDKIHLWEFDDRPRRIGSTEGWNQHPTAPRSINEQFRQMISLLGDPDGGTETGAALSATIGHEPGADILLVTDGLTYALDIQRLARHRRRISVVLIGESALEATVGHLAALTGGDVFVASEADIDTVVVAALRAMRVKRTAEQQDGLWRVSGAELVRTAADHSPADPLLGKAVAGLLASLELASLPDDRAAQFAEAEGLVTHLTSLVLVDAAGAKQDGQPRQRPVPLPATATSENLTLSRAMFDLPSTPNFARSSSSERAEVRLHVRAHDPKKDPAIILFGAKTDQVSRLEGALEKAEFQLRAVSDLVQLEKAIRSLPEARWIAVIVFPVANKYDRAEEAIRLSRVFQVIVLGDFDSDPGHEENHAEARIVHVKMDAIDLDFELVLAELKRVGKDFVKAALRKMRG